MRSGNNSRNNTAKGSLNNYAFDFGLGIQSSGSNQKLNTAAANSKPQYNTQQQPRWSHVPAANKLGSNQAPATAMAGDITGKTWVPMDKIKTAGPNVGVVGGVGTAKSDMFGDLLALGRSSAKTNTNKNLSGASASSGSFSMATSISRGGPSLKESKNKSSSDPFDSFVSAKPPNATSSTFSKHDTSDDFGIFVTPVSTSSTTSAKHDSMDEFGDFVTPSPSDPFASKATQNKANVDPFGDFVGSSSSSSFGFSHANPPADDLFGMHSVPPFNYQASPTDDIFGVPSSNYQAANSKNYTSNSDLLSDMFANVTIAPAAAAASIKTTSTYIDPLETLWRKSTDQSSSTKQTVTAPSSDNWLQDADNWVTGAEEEKEMTTEIEGLPRPPAGVTSVLAKEKGLEYHKQGQFADAIKWLTWAVDLCNESNGGVLIEVLTCRVTCYKEIGEYKKAVEDCSKILELRKFDADVLVQRAFLYESMEKYKLGVQDLKEVVKRDPSNRMASNTLSRLVKMLD